MFMVLCACWWLWFALLEGGLTGVELAAVACLLLDVMLQLYWLQEC